MGSKRRETALAVGVATPKLSLQFELIFLFTTSQVQLTINRNVSSWFAIGYTQQ